MQCGLSFCYAWTRKWSLRTGRCTFFYWCVVHLEGALHLTNVSALQPVHEVMNKSSKTEVLEAPGVQVVTAKKTLKWMYIVSLCDVLFTL